MQRGLARIAGQLPGYLGLLALAVAVFWIGTQPWSDGAEHLYRYAWLARFPLLAGAVIIGLGFAGTGGSKPMLGGLLDVNRLQLAVAVSATALAWTGICEVLRTIVFLAPARFPDAPSIGESSTGVRWLLLEILRHPTFRPGLNWLQFLPMLPLVAALIRGMPPRRGWNVSEWGWRIGTAGLALGLTLVMASVATAGFESLLVSRSSNICIGPDWLGPGWLGPGYFDVGKCSLQAPLPQHLKMAAFVALTISIYVFAYFALHPKIRSGWRKRLRDGIVPPLFHALLLLLMAVQLLAALSFLLDYWRVSTLLTVAAFSYGAYRWILFDHYFRTLPLDPRIVATGPESEKESPLRDEAAGAARNKRAAASAEAFESRPRRNRQAIRSGAAEPAGNRSTATPKARNPSGSGGDAPRKAVVISAYGGGILAGAWCVRAMTGLAKAFPELPGKTCLISSVSGGSVGTLYLVDAMLARAAGPLTDGEIAALNSRIRQSSLEATAWGLACPGLIRLLAPVVIWDPLYDNGWAMELRWMGEMKDEGLTLGQCMRAAREGRCPVVIMNAVCVETGQRFLLSTDRFQDRQQGTKRVFDFFGEYSRRDIPLVTAARISASFPFVTPISRIDRCASDPAFHFADGGYADNFGVFSALEWIRDHLDSRNREPADRLAEVDEILLVQICSRAPPPASGSLRTGWSNTLVGPLATVLKARSTSQSERVESEVDAFAAWCRQDHGVEFQRAVVELDYAGPLSWRLSDIDCEALDTEWGLYEQALAGNDPPAYDRPGFGQQNDPEGYWQRRCEKIVQSADVLRKFL